MNSDLDRLQPYPFQKLRNLLHGITPNSALAPISLSIGEPKHHTPAFIRDNLNRHMDGLAHYPTTNGTPELRNAIANWLQCRYALTTIDPRTQILPVNGSREALFSFAQAVVDRHTDNERPLVISPNPFYQIYEGAALLAGAEPFYFNMLDKYDYIADTTVITVAQWRRVQLIYVCSPANPTGRVMSLDEWQQLFEWADRFNFIIAADECYSEIYPDEKQPPLGALQAAAQLGRTKFERLVVFNSLSKRSNVPGMRSGFVAGDATIIEKFLLYRTYHGCAMNPAVQAASAAAWAEETHVRENRRLYRQKFDTVVPLLREVTMVRLPDAGFYLWLQTPGADTDFAQGLYRDYNVTVLPGTYLARDAHGINPGNGFVRIALVAKMAECLDSTRRIQHFIRALHH